MKSFITTGCIFLLAIPAIVFGQDAPTAPAGPGPAEAPAAGTVVWQDAGPIRGVRELTFAGSGGSNRHLTDSFGGATVSYGVYINDEWQAVLRQSLNYANPDGGNGRTWNGFTKVALDYHVTTLQAFMPFVGVNAGRIYGTALHDSWSAGLEVGAKYYIQSKLFVFAMVDYSWLFDRGEELEDNFGSGHFTWSTGIGFNF
jgi:hypothetical protein